MQLIKELIFLREAVSKWNDPFVQEVVQLMKDTYGEDAMEFMLGDEPLDLHSLHSDPNSLDAGEHDSNDAQMEKFADTVLKIRPFFEHHIAANTIVHFGYIEDPEGLLHLISSHFSSSDPLINIGGDSEYGETDLVDEERGDIHHFFEAAGCRVLQSLGWSETVDVMETSDGKRFLRSDQINNIMAPASIADALIADIDKFTRIKD